MRFIKEVSAAEVHGIYFTGKWVPDCKMFENV